MIGYETVIRTSAVLASMFMNMQHLRYLVAYPQISFGWKFLVIVGNAKLPLQFLTELKSSPSLFTCEHFVWLHYNPSISLPNLLQFAFLMSFIKCTGEVHDVHTSDVEPW